jgi:hypothetical protein
VFPTPSSVVSRTEAVIDGLGAPFEMRGLLTYPLSKAEAQLERDSRWPVLHLPLRLGAEFGLSPEVVEGLACACLLLYGFADLTDDAQDGDLQGDWGWERAVNAGFALSFLGQEQLGRLDLPAEPKLRLVQAFAKAGRLMTFGQDGDLRAAYPAVPSIEQYMTTITQKTGASVAYFAMAPAIAAQVPDERVARLSTYGESLGAFHQIMSDLSEYLTPMGSGSDLRNRKLTLPILYGLAQDPSDHIRAWLEGSAPEEDLSERLARLGAPAYCRMKAQLFRRKALAELEALALSPEVDAELRAYLKDPSRATMLEL